MKLEPIFHTTNPENFHIANGNQQSVFDRIQHMYDRDGYSFPWVGYFAIANGEIVGACGFKNSPRENRVEIAYQTFAEYEGKGIATEMCRSLLQLAQAANAKIIVFAETREANHASHRILEKNGFQRTEEYQDEKDGKIWVWEKNK